MTNKKDYTPALGYDWLTGFYDLAIKLTMPEKKFRTRLIDELNPLDKEKILEFGYGTGQHLLLAVARNHLAQYTGLDIDPKAKNIVERKLRKREIEIILDIYNGETFPYKDNSFDKVYSSLVFHHLDGDTKSSCLLETHRVLKPGGQLIIGDWGKAKTKLMRFAFYAVQLLDGFKTTKDNVEGKLPDIIKNAGFEKVNETGYINTKIGTYCYYSGQKPGR